VSEPKREFVTFRMSNSAHGGAIVSEAERIGGVLFTLRRARWLRGYLAALAEGATGDAAAIRGARLGGVGGSAKLGDLVVKKKMEAFLALPDVKQAMRAVYEEGAEFDLTDAVALHKKHMEGYTVEQEQVTKDGEVVAYTQTIPPSWPALKDYLDRTTPKEPARLNVLTARVGQPREVRTDGSSPPMASRSIGDIVDP
jgi:hypothetical protein